MTVMAHALAAHLEATEPRIQPRDPMQTEQFIDAPPPEKYPSRWRRDCADNPDALYTMNPEAVKITNSLRSEFNCQTEKKK